MALVAGVAVRTRARIAISSECTPLEVGTRTLGGCTAGELGDIGILGIGRALGRYSLLSFGQALCPLGDV